MKENIQKYYRKHESYKRYLISDKKRVNEIKKVYNNNKKYFGKRVLDIACGGGILGFLIEPKGHTYTGVDINPDMVYSARDYSKEIKSKNNFILADIKNKKLNGKFDTITFIGNALSHFTTLDFINVLKNIPNTKYIIIDYRDLVKMFFYREWRDNFIEKKAGKILINNLKDINFQEGYTGRISHEKGKNDKNYFTHTIWSPFILEPIMISNGWKLVKRKEEKRWNGWLDVYKNQNN